MLTHGLWQRRYGADPAIVGKAIMVNDRARTVIGVLPPKFKFPLIDQLYMPLRLDELPRSSRNVNAVAMLKPGVTIAQAASELQEIARQLEQTYPLTNRGFGVRAVPIRQSYVDAGTDRVSVVLMTGGRLRAADHVREPRQPDAGARRVPAARARGAGGDGREPCAPALGLARGKRPAGDSGRGAGPARSAMGRRLDNRVVSRRAAVLVRVRCRRHRRGVRDRGWRIHGPRGGFAAGGARRQARSRQRSERGWRAVCRWVVADNGCRPRSRSRRWRSASACWSAPT